MLVARVGGWAWVAARMRIEAVAARGNADDCCIALHLAIAVVSSVPIGRRSFK